jgi:hypothetical protein
MKPKFDLGRIVVKLLAAAVQDKEFFLDKHAMGDWGEEDVPLNEQGLRDGSLVMSRYKTLCGEPLCVLSFLRTKETVLYRGPNSGAWYVTESLPQSPIDQFSYTMSDGHETTAHTSTLIESPTTPTLPSATADSFGYTWPHGGRLPGPR